MQEIEPSRLRDIRMVRGLSRGELQDRSGVSARQIKRIEDADGATRSRAKTVECLAQALELDVRVLTGEHEVPEELRDARVGTQIDAGRLRALRKQRDWSQKRLARESGVSLAQIRRIEQGTVGAGRRYSLERLARAFRVEPEVLTGAHPLNDPVAQVDRSKVQVSARVSAELRLAYDLIALRYGAQPKDLIQLAPLMFALIAEGSLRARLDNLDRARQTRDQLRGLSSEPMLYFAKYMRDVDVGMEAEEQSIASSDVLGRQIWDGSDEDGRFHEDDSYGRPVRGISAVFGRSAGPSEGSSRVSAARND